MSKDKKKRQVWVYPDFKNVLKSTAEMHDKSVLEYTKDISEDLNPIERMIKDYNEKHKKKKFDFM